MKIEKRKGATLFGSSGLIVIPIMTYLSLKLAGIIDKREWLWWIAIPVMALIWFFVNFKITRQKNG